MSSESEFDLHQEIMLMKRKLSNQRRWNLASIFICVLFYGSFFVMGSTDVKFFRDIRVKRFALVDNNGVERLIIEADNHVAIVNGKPIERGQNVSGIILQNAKGDEMGGMGTLDNGTAAIALDSYTKYGTHGATDRVGMISLPDGTAGFMLNDLQAKSRVQIMSGPSLDAEIKMFSANDELPKIHGKVTSEGAFEWNP